MCVNQHNSENEGCQGTIGHCLIRQWPILLDAVMGGFWPFSLTVLTIFSSPSVSPVPPPLRFVFTEGRKSFSLIDSLQSLGRGVGFGPRSGSDGLGKATYIVYIYYGVGNRLRGRGGGRDGPASLRGYA